MFLVSILKRMTDVSQITYTVLVETLNPAQSNPIKRMWLLGPPLYNLFFKIQLLPVRMTLVSCVFDIFLCLLYNVHVLISESIFQCMFLSDAAVGLGY